MLHDLVHHKDDETDLNIGKLIVQFYENRMRVGHFIPCKPVSGRLASLYAKRNHESMLR